MNPPSTATGRDETATLPSVPMSGPDISPTEVARVMEVLRSGCLSIGPQIDAFERRVEIMTGARHAIGVSSGTAGLHLAVIGAGVTDGDLVITTPFSFVASANCVLYERGIPVFVDVDPVTGNIDAGLAAQAARDIRSSGVAAQRWLPRALRRRPVGRLKAILPVHAFGQPADMDPLLAVAEACNVPLLEDACEAVGSEYKGRRAGTIGTVGVLAFYPNKQATTGEGGMILTDRDDLDRLFRSLRNQGRAAMSAWLEHERLGYNYRMDEMSAALGVGQFSRLPELLAARDRVAGWYSERLAGAAGLTVPRVVPAVTRMSWFAYVVRLTPPALRRPIMADLAQRGIPSRPYFIPIHLQPFYASRFGYRRGDYPMAEELGDCCLALPFSGIMTESQVDRVCRELLAAVAHHLQNPVVVAQVIAEG